VQGFPALTVSNGLVSFTTLPELGGKISSIRDLRTSREWLWSNDRTPYRRLEYGVSYVEEADTGGWDECFPTVAECPYPLEPSRGLRMPDHGELWPQAWRAEVQRADGGLSVRTEVDGVALPYEFDRQVRLEAGSDTVRFDYEVTSKADHDLAFIWSAHPLFAAEPGMRVFLPEHTIMRAYSSFPSELFPDDERGWPPRVKVRDEELDLSTLPDASAGVALKLWSRPLSEGWAALIAGDDELRFAFDPKLLPQVGLWLNLGGWSGTGAQPYYNLALEPCIGAQDSLQEAVERYGQYAVLPAHGSRQWWLEVRLRRARQ
jgi:galactose mutarotase-like enzyme